MRIVILGGTGYLGSRVVRALLRDGNEVLCVKRESSSLESLHDVLGQIHICNLENLRENLAWTAPYDVMVNLACMYPRNAKNDIEIFDANMNNPMKVFLECLNQNVKRFITMGTGLPDDLNAYTISKANLIRIMKWYGVQCGYKKRPIQICNVRLENFYGENEPTDRFIPGTINRLKKGEKILLTEGDQIRDFVYIDDVVEAIVHLIYQENMPEYSDVPLGTGEGVTIRELITYLKEITESSSELCFGAIEKRINEPNSVADRDAMDKFGIKIHYSWREGMKRII